MLIPSHQNLLIVNIPNYTKRPTILLSHLSRLKSYKDKFYIVNFIFTNEMLKLFEVLIIADISEMKQVLKKNKIRKIMTFS